jgi:glycosyltransferase involved in cell wall biosynthesis
MTSIEGIEGATPIAVIVVCRNALDRLKATLASIERLADPRVRIVVIDGASSDGTPGYLRESGGWAHFTVSEPDGGIYDAMNKGWSAAPAGSYVLYMGAGDLLLELPPAGELVDLDGRSLPVVLGHCTVGSMSFDSRWGWEMQLRNTAHHQAMMVLKDVWPRPPFDTTLRLYADWDFNLRLLKAGIRAHKAKGFRSYAEPGGASWAMDVNEIRKVASRHGGRLVGAAAWALNSVSRWRRQRRLHR